MKRLFGFSSVFTKISLLAFLVCVLCVSCNNSAKPAGKPAGQQQGGADLSKWSDIEAAEEITMKDFEDIIADPSKINNYLLVDVRYIEDKIDTQKPYEYQAGHTFCGVSIPFNCIAYDAGFDKKDPTIFNDTKIFNFELSLELRVCGILFFMRLSNVFLLVLSGFFKQVLL